MDYLEEVQTYCNLKVINSIENSYSKIVGIISDLNLINEHDKNVGSIVLIKNVSKMLYLELTVEFNSKKIKWSANNNSPFGFYLVDPYWVKAYTPAPKIRVPIKVIDIKSNQIITEMRELNYKQFMKNRLHEFYGEFQHKYIAAYENFNHMFKNNQYYHAINSTVKNYRISQKELVKILGLIDNEKKKIKAEWNLLINRYFHQDQGAKSIEELYGKNSRKNIKSNVISFEKR